jgi:hypothetical protein
VGILGLPIFGTKYHLDASPVVSHIMYYKGKVVASLVRAMVSIVSSSLPVTHPSAKSASTMQ